MISRTTRLSVLRALMRAHPPCTTPGNVVSDQMARSIQQSMRDAGYDVSLEVVHEAARRVLSRSR